MNFSYTQISQFLSCPRRYRFSIWTAGRKKIRAPPCSSGAPLRKHWPPSSCVRTPPRSCSTNGPSIATSIFSTPPTTHWDRMLQGGMQLLDRFAQEDRVRILQPQTNLQVKILRPLPGDNAFVSYVDAIGELDDELCVIDWKTSTSCYPTEPAGLCALDPQMICYSWMTGIERVALVVFVRKRMPEIRLIRQQGVDLDWLDELDLLQFVLSRKELSGFVLQIMGLRLGGATGTWCLRCLLLFYRNTILSPSDIL